MDKTPKLGGPGVHDMKWMAKMMSNAKKYIIIFSAFLVAGCDGGNIGVVKDGLMSMNKTLTVGEAFDKWRECEKKEWSEFKTDNGVNVVQFECDSITLGPFIFAVKDLSGDQGPYLDIVKSTFVVQWTTNKDGSSFQLEYVGDNILWADGKLAKQPVKNQISTVEDVYSNKFRYDADQLWDASGNQGQYVSKVLSQAYRQMYEGL